MRNVHPAFDLIPDNWQLQKASRVIDLSVGGTPPTSNPDYFDGDVPWLTISGMDTDTIYECDKSISQEGMKVAGISWTRPGDLLYSFKLSIGKVAWAGIEMATNEAIASIHPSSDIHLPYARWVLPMAFQAAAGTNIYGASLLNQEQLRQAMIPLPPRKEQQKIADYLDRETAEIDAFVSDLQVLSFLAREHFNSLRSKTLRQPSSVEKNPDSHSVPLTRVLPHRVDYRGATPIKVDEGIQLVTARNIRPGWIDYESSQEFVSSEDYSQVMSRGLPARGDILFTMEAPLGNAALVDRTDVALAQRVIKFTPAPGVDPSFMCHVMNSDEFQHQLRELATGSTALGLKASKLHQLQVLVPDLATQTQAVRTLDEAWASVVDLQHLVDEATRLASERRAALISAAVTGQIDVTAQGVSAAEQLRDELEVHV